MRPKGDEATYQQINNFKGELELWYQRHRSTATDSKIIFLTAWSIFFPKSKLVYRFFPSLPVMEEEHFVIVTPIHSHVTVLTQQAV